jgi:iron complex outermembrane receptor protein
MKFYYILLLILSYNVGQSQTSQISGKIISENNDAISNVSVTIKQQKTMELQENDTLTLTITLREVINTLQTEHSFSVFFWSKESLLHCRTALL